MAFVICKDVLEARELMAGGVSWDLENVVGDFNGNDAVAADAILRPEVLELMHDWSGKGVLQGIVTHNRSGEYVDAVQRQMQDATGQDVPALSKKNDNEGGVDKLKPATFSRMAGLLGVDSEDMVHIDDQFKSHIGAIRHGYGFKIWPMPWGEHQHPGVKRARPVEMAVVRRIVKAWPSTIILG